MKRINSANNRQRSGAAFTFTCVLACTQLLYAAPARLSVEPVYTNGRRLEKNVEGRGYRAPGATGACGNIWATGEAKYLSAARESARAAANQSTNPAIHSDLSNPFYLALTACATLAPTAAAEIGNLPKPTPAQLAWQQAELGVVFHYDLHLFDDKRYNQNENRRHAIEDANIFKPTRLDTDQWLRVARDMGARFAILTASHETGFRLWQSDANPYCLKAVKWGDGKRDIVAEFVASCGKFGIKPGIYMGTRWNSRLSLWDFKVTERSPVTQAEYNSMIEKEVEEICSRYGPLFELWFDGGAHGPAQGGPDVQSIFEKHQPDCLFYHNHDRADARWGGTESGTVPYPCWATMPFAGSGGPGKTSLINADNFRLIKHGDPDGHFWCPAMSDAPLRNHEWFWENGDEKKLYPLPALINMYYKSIGHNSTLIIGLTPDNRGLIPEADAKRCAEWGDAIRRTFNNCVGQTRGNDKDVELALDEPTAFDHIVLQEDIRQGERVREYAVEAMLGGTWSTIAKGTCVGHKRIHQLAVPVTAEKIRMRIGKSTATPVISRLAIYLADDTTEGAGQSPAGGILKAAPEE